MRAFTTSYYPSVMFKEGASIEICEILKKKGNKKILVVYDKGVFKAGLITPIIDSIRHKGIDVCVYDGVEPDAPDYTIEEGRKAAITNKVDGVVGIGGGSTLDTAKMIATYMEGETPISRYYSDAPNQTADPLPNRKVGLILAPTTAGTGSEVTGVSVITDTSVRQKRTVWGGAKFMADLAVVDPCLMIGLPPYVTATTGMDALAHSLETMTSSLRSCRSDALSGQSVEYIWRSLPKAFQDGKDMEARSELAVAAGMTLTTDGSRHMGHAIGHAIGGRYHIAHGHACALALPAAMRYVAKDAAKEMQLIADKMHLQVPNKTNIGEYVANALEDMNKQLGLKTLPELGIAWEDFMKVLPEIMADEKYLSKLDTRPTEEAVLHMLHEVYYGKQGQQEP